MRHHPDWLRAYLKFTSHSEAPQAFHLWTGVATIAGALQRHVWIDQHIFQWTPNFYIIFVGPPGVVSKSTTMKIGLGLLPKVPGVHIGPNSLTWQALTEALSDAYKSVPMVNGVRPDDLVNQMFEPMCCLTCAISELGTFLNTQDRELVDVLTDLWDGQKDVWRRSTKTQGKTKVENPWLNISACTTPSWLANNFPESMIGGGLCSRIIFVYAEEKEKLIAYPGLGVNHTEYNAQKKLLIDDLIQISKIKGEYRLTLEAIEWGEAWYKDHQENCPEHLLGERFQPYRHRKQGHLHKTAMVVAAAQSDEHNIEVEHLQLADLMLKGVETDMAQVFKAIGVVPDAQNLSKVLTLLRARGPMTRDELLRSCINLMPSADFELAMKNAHQAGYVKLQGMKYHLQKEKKE